MCLANVLSLARARFNVPTAWTSSSSTEENIVDQPIKRRELFDLASACLAGLAVSKLTACVPATGDTPRDNVGEDDRALLIDPPGQHVALLVYPDMTLLDLVGPHTCFSALGMTLHLVWKTLDPITTESGVVIMPTTTFDFCPNALEILFIPGSDSRRRALREGSQPHHGCGGDIGQRLRVTHRRPTRWARSRGARAADARVRAGATDHVRGT
jgi:hypothetical protein